MTAIEIARECGAESEPQSLPSVVNPKAPGDLTVGDYVFASRWGDCDANDPWAVDFVTIAENGYVVLSGARRWPHAMRITPEQGKRICDELPALEGSPRNYAAIAEIFGVPEMGCDWKFTADQLSAFAQRVQAEAREAHLPSSYVNAAGISASDMPATVVQKLDAAALRSLKSKVGGESTGVRT